LISPLNWLLMPARYVYCPAMPPMPSVELLAHGAPVKYVLPTPNTYPFMIRARCSVPFASGSPGRTMLKLNPPSMKPVPTPPGVTLACTASSSSESDPLLGMLV
jgi:hypothetical protein